tara:strand:- start:588 stop:1268 length:681 start_codon:yes stop_codon:yes gene_type:complete
MNFYSNKLSSKKYLKVIKTKKKLSKEFILQNFGSLIGDRSLFKFLTCFELLKKTKKVKGDILEFGVWNGNNLISLKKIHDYLKLDKKIIGYDHFKGMPKNSRDFYRNSFHGDLKFLKKLIKFFKFKNLNLINDDILNLNNHLNKFNKLSFVYIDCDLYFTTKKILDLLSKKLSKGGVIIFDEGNQNLQKSGETKALKEFFKKNKKYFLKRYMKNGYQPDVYLEKIC